MNDVERMLLEAIKPSLAALEKKKLGGISGYGEGKGIYYFFNGKEYLISAKEVEEGE